MIVLIGGEKGGPGKTTLATNLATLRAAAGRDVLIVDTDKQGSASYWSASRDENGVRPRIACLQKFGKALVTELQDLSERYEDIIVDAGGRDSTELRAAMVAADRLFVPLQASQFDVWTLARMNELVGQAQSINVRLRAAIVINRASTNPAVREAEELGELLADFENIGFSDVVVRDRIAFRRAAASGLAVSEVEAPDAKAVAEMESFYNAVYQEAVSHG